MLLLRSKGQYFIGEGEQEWTFDITEASAYDNDGLQELIDLIDGFQEYRVEIINTLGIVIYCNKEKEDAINNFFE